jgi:hypothetical protein
MRAHPFRIGGVAALIGIVAWCLEWRLQLHALNPIVLCAKVLALFALVFCVHYLASRLFQSWRLAVILWLVLSASSVAALFAVIPFRLWMPRWANDGVRRWYYEGMPYPENDYERWLVDWHGYGPHLFEALILLVFFALLLVPAVLFRFRLRFAIGVCFLGYMLLAIAPVGRDLLAFDYDTFHLGIALDSIALSLWPMGLGYSNAHTIFTLCFLLIIFTVSGVFLVLPFAHPKNQTIQEAEQDAPSNGG